MNAPTYALYGELLENVSQEVVHCETIRERSVRYDWLIKPHKHRQYAQVFLFRSPGVDVRLGTDVHHLDEPAILFVPPLVVHGFRFPDTISGLVATLDFAFVAQFLERFGLAEELLNATVLLRPDEPRFSVLQSGLEGIETQLHDMSGLHQTRLKLLAEKMLVGLVECALDRKVHGERPSNHKSHERMRAFFSLLEENFASAEPVDFYARQLALSTVQLTRICRQVTGSSPHELLTARRLLEAKRLLRFTSHRVGEIADGLSFANIAYFSRFFKRHTGLSPGAFRQEDEGRNSIA